jgi:chromosome segregation ATPase
VVVDERITAADVQLQRLEKKIQDAGRMEGELKEKIQEIRKPENANKGGFRRNLSGCDSLLAVRLIHIQTLEITRENYQGRIVRWRAELQRAPNLAREIARLKQEVEQTRAQIKDADDVEMRINAQLDGEASAMLKTLDARGKAATAKIRNLVGEMMKERLPIPPRLHPPSSHSSTP